MVDKITNIDEYEAEFKKVIGKEQEIPGYWTASKDNILVYADALGDSNPLWRDEEYARKSRLGVITAPPTFLYKVNVGDWGAGAGSLTTPSENTSQMYSGVEFRLFRPIYVGDVFTVKQKAFSSRTVESKTRGKILFNTGENSYFNQRKEPVGINYSTIAIVPVVRAGAGGAPPVRVHDPDKGTKEAKDPDLCAFEQKRRGAKPRYWEDVEVGQELEPLEKGVLTATDITRWQLNVLGRQPRFMTRPRGGLVVGLGRAAVSQLAHGVQDPEDFGPQRCAWLGQLLTDWMGDDGTLKKFSCQVRGPNMMGDKNVVKGKVTKKYIEAGEHLVDCDIWCENQGDVVTCPGTGTVALPSRG